MTWTVWDWLGRWASSLLFQISIGYLVRCFVTSYKWCVIKCHIVNFSRRTKSGMKGSPYIHNYSNTAKIYCAVPAQNTQNVCFQSRVKDLVDIYAYSDVKHARKIQVNHTTEDKCVVRLWSEAKIISHSRCDKSFVALCPKNVICMLCVQCTFIQYLITTKITRNFHRKDILRIFNYFYWKCPWSMSSVCIYIYNYFRIF